MRRFVIGDIHGRVAALEHCLALAGFNREEDLLISLGDVCDRGEHTRESLDLLLQIKNLVYILGNHDHWFLEWALSGGQNIAWTAQGGRKTIRSYGGGPVPEEHIRLLQKAPLWYLLDNDTRLFVHAGIDPEKALEEQSETDLLWSRQLVQRAMEVIDDPGVESLTPYKEVYVGHTPTINYDFTVPLFIKGVWMMDTGAGWWGKLTIMDVDTKEYWQSDRGSSKLDARSSNN
jgi:serine/threonine protein phosphatase 1